MSVTVTTDIFCDGEGCSQWTFGTTGPRVNAMEARRKARFAGWSCGRQGDFCPDCRKKRNGEPHP